MRFSGDRLRRLRISAGYSLDELSKMVDIEDNSISEFEQDSILPRLETLIEIANILNVSMDMFFI